MTPQHPPASLYRTTEGLGLWEHRGKVAAVGVGHSPTAALGWHTRDLCSAPGASWPSGERLQTPACRQTRIDGLVLDPVTTTGAYWPKGVPVPWTSSTPFILLATPWTGLPS